MRDDIFVDTGAWYAVQVSDDRWHSTAVQALSEFVAQGARLTTTNCVIGETYTLLLRTHGHDPAWSFVKRVRASPRLDWVHVDEDTEEEAYGLLHRYRDQTFSFVDGTSFIVMRERKIRHAFAFDVHFATAGFTRVPLDSPKR